MTSLNVKPGLLPSSIVLPRSKSHANRALILAALAARTTTISQVPKASDVTKLVSALRMIGLQISGTESLSVSGEFPKCEPKGGKIIDVGEGGTTGRFLACLLLLGREPYQLILGQRLKRRPWEEFLALAKNLGAEASLDGNKLSLQGPINVPSSLEVDCARTTQFASGFFLALSRTRCDVRAQNLKSSQSYWDLTRVMRDEFLRSENYVVPIDWSSASYPLAFGALKQSISFPGLRYDPSQADEKFYQLLSSLGAIDEKHGDLAVKPVVKVHDVKLDVSDCLDLVPALAFFLAHVPGQHELQNIENLRHKESDRLTEVRDLLSKFDKKTSVRGNHLYLLGDGSTVQNKVDLTLPDDHRMVMTAALFLRFHAGGSLTPAEAVAKSYPGFFDLVNF